jgi:orotidine-5'-phosphate decarboxylase
MWFEAFRSNSPLSIGIDPYFVSMPKFMTRQIEKNGSKKFLIDFGMTFLEVAKAQKVPTLKFQMAFFEAQGSEGFAALKALTLSAKEKQLAVVLDGKRGDIASTMAAYGSSAFDELKADAITVMPYMGTDSFKALLPWLKKGKCIYSVCLPSNPSAGIYISDEKANSYALDLATGIAKFLEHEQVLQSLGFVVGANRLDAWQNRAKSVPDCPLLLPGMGAQGAKLSEASKLFLKSRNMDLMPVSRGVAGFGEGYLNPDLDRMEDWSEYQHWVEGQVAELKTHLLD